MIRLRTLLSIFIPLPLLLSEASWAQTWSPELDYLDYPPKDDSSVELNEPSSTLPATPFIDLESKTREFVLATKRLKIARFPDAFNPSITRWHGTLLMSFRIYDRKAGTTDKIGLIWLDDNFRQLGQPKILKVLVPDLNFLTKKQDPRLITVGDRLFIVYNNVVKNVVDRELRRMLIAEVHFDGEDFYSTTPTYLTHFDGVNDKRSEKNWVPFVYENSLLLGYSLTPHRILRPLLGMDQCEEVATSQGSIDWKWGPLRGGTPALLDGNHYLAFFHSSKSTQTVHSKGRNIPHYFMGAYTFSAHPPFSITSISKEPIVGKNFYHGESYKTWKPLQVVFPAGFIFDDRYVWVVYGRQDHEIWVAKLDKLGLLRSLVPVATKEQK